MSTYARKVNYTADLRVPDGSDTGPDGDPCEPGCGEVARNGWWSPDWSQWKVFDDPACADPDVYEDDRAVDPDAPSPARWLADQIIKRLGAVEGSPRCGWRSVDGYTHPYEGKSVIGWAHPDGWPEAELEEAHAILKAKGYLTTEVG